MMSELSEPLENYLKEIYELEETKGQAKVVDLIEAFSISPGTISKALERLESLGFIDRSTKRIRLTEDGRKVAERLIRAHRLSERLLTDILEVDWIRAHELAQRLAIFGLKTFWRKWIGSLGTQPRVHTVILYLEGFKRKELKVRRWTTFNQENIGLS